MTRHIKGLFVSKLAYIGTVGLAPRYLVCETHVVNFRSNLPLRDLQSHDDPEYCFT